ncbi:MAG: histidinol phosphatase, partial [Limnochordales bacterium]
MTAYQDDLRLAHELADAADAITMRRFQAGDLQVETKPDLTPVSDADRAVEQAVRELTGRAR